MSWEDVKESKWFKWGREALLVVLILGGVMTYQTWSHVSSGTQAPAFDFPVLDSKERISTADLRGKPTLVYFWAPWCGVCEASSDNVNAVHDAVGDDYDVVSVVLEYESPETARDFVRRNDVRYPVLLGDAETTRAYKIDAFPTLYVLDSEGQVDSSVVGYTTEIGMRARLWWAK